MLFQYKTRGNGVDFDLIFYNLLTVIMGESGVGKTVLFKALEEDSILGSIDAICLNYDDIKTGAIGSTLRTARNKIIVIDNADVILTPEQKFMISTDKRNQYIVFSHSVQGFHPTVKGIAELKVKNNKGTLDYVMM